MLKILFIGDVVGRPGRRVLRRLMPELKERYRADLVIANAENSAGGIGATPSTVGELHELGVDIITMGNHVWRHSELVARLDELPYTLRPANYPPGTPGHGAIATNTQDGTPVAVLNLQGRVFMEPIDCPFRTAQRLVPELKEQARIIIVDFHAEATSEKVAMGWFLDGKVTAVIGTHTHVATADERILHHGTAYITDVGMTGPHDSVIGVKKEIAIRRFVQGIPIHFQVAKGEERLEAVLIECDPATGRASAIHRLRH